MLPDAVLEHIIPAMLVAVRIGGLVLFAPIIGSSAVPVRVRVLLVAAISLAVYPSLHARGLVGGNVEPELFALVAAVAIEVTFGAFIGFIAGLPLVAAQIGGHMIGQQMGLGFAMFFDPTIEDDSDVMGQLFYFFTLALFLLIGGHEAMILAVLHSFEHVASGGPFAAMSMVDMVTGLLTAGCELALRVAAPVLAIVMLETIAMGFIAKTVPQLNVLSLGFPLRILVSWATLIIGIVVIQQVLVEGLDDGLDAMFQWVEIAAEEVADDGR